MNYVKADPNRQYWRASEKGMTYMPEVRDIRRQMRFAFENYNNLLINFSKKYDNILSNYTWNKSAEKIIKLYDSI